MRKSEEFYVDEKRYFITQYDVPFGLTLGGRLAKILGKPMGLFMKAQDKDVGDVIGEAVSALFENMKPEELPNLVQQILTGTHIFEDNGRHRQIKIEIDLDDYGHIFNLLKVVFGFQFESLKKAFAAFRGAAPIAPIPEIKNQIKAI